MKKVILLAAVAILATTVSSCRKDRTCTCKSTVGSTTISTGTTAKSTKKDAKAWCDAAQAKAGSGITCEID